MKTLILFILITIANASSKKMATAENTKRETVGAAQHSQPAAAEQLKPSSNDDLSLEMPNNWNLKVIEW